MEKEVKVGDKMQYNETYNEKEVVTVLKIDCGHCIVEFPSGYKLVTTISGLWPLKK